MFCTKCGTQNREDSAFCKNCGTALKSGVEKQVTPVVRRKKKRFLIPIIATSVVVTILVAMAVILLNFLPYEDGYENAVKEFFVAVEKRDVQALMDKRYPREIQEEYFQKKEDNSYKSLMTREFLYDKTTAVLESYHISEWNIKTAEEIGELNELEEKAESYGAQDMEGLRRNLKVRYSAYGFEVDKVNEAYAVEVNLKTDTRSLERFDIIYKYKGQWYFLMGLGCFYIP